VERGEDDVVRKTPVGAKRPEEEAWEEGREGGREGGREEVVRMTSCVKRQLVPRGPRRKPGRKGGREGGREGGKEG